MTIKNVLMLPLGLRPHVPPLASYLRPDIAMPLPSLKDFRPKSQKIKRPVI